VRRVCRLFQDLVVGWRRRRVGVLAEEAEGFERAVVGALGRIDAALEAAEGGLATGEGLAGSTVVFGSPGILHFAFEDLGIDSAKATEQPLVVDEDVDEEAFFGGSGKEALAIFPGEGFKGGRVFAADEVGFGVDAGLESIHAGDGLARNGAWAGGTQGVKTIRRDLFDGWHKKRTGGRPVQV
jgi:hypothetical protein